MKMTNKELIEHMRTENLGMYYLIELQAGLDEELKKPVSEQDFDRIEDLTEAISVLNGTDQFISKRTEIGIARVKADIHQNKHRKIRIRRRWIAACICAALIGSNAWSYTAYGMNAFSAAYQIFTGDLSGDTLSNIQWGDGITEAGKTAYGNAAAKAESLVGTEGRIFARPHTHESHARRQSSRSANLPRKRKHRRGYRQRRKRLARPKSRRRIFSFERRHDA